MNNSNQATVVLD